MYNKLLKIQKNGGGRAKTVLSRTFGPASFLIQKHNMIFKFAHFSHKLFIFIILRIYYEGCRNKDGKFEHKASY